MPLYEYHCQDCSNDFEKMMRFSEANASPVCPNCGGHNTHKQISTFASKNMSSAGSSVSTSSCGTSGGFR